MDPGSETAGMPGEYAGLHFIDGTSSQRSYAVIARHGYVFLGVRFLGLVDGDELGVPGKTYLHARVRSARDQALADKLDLEGGPRQRHKPVPAAVGAGRGLARLHVREDRWRARQPHPGDVHRRVIGRQHRRCDRTYPGRQLVRKLVNYVADRAGLEHSIARAKLIAMWMFDQLKPSLAGLKKTAEHQKIVVAAQKEFAGLVEGQVEVVGPHLKQLNAIYHKHHP